MRRIDALHANRRIFIIDDVNESLQPIYDHMKQEMFQKRILMLPQRQVRVKQDGYKRSSEPAANGWDLSCKWAVQTNRVFWLVVGELFAIRPKKLMTFSGGTEDEWQGKRDVQFLFVL